MKETVKTSRAVGQLEKMFREVNKDLFGGEIEEPIITIQTTPCAYGHVTVGKTWKRKDDWRHELNFGAETLARPIEEVTATLIHEMVHLYNIKHNVQDCSRGGSYHNKKFKEEAEKHLLHIEKHEKYGWTLTSPTDKLLEYILDKEWSEIQINRGFSFPSVGKPSGDKTGTKPNGEGEDKPKAKSSYRKHRCPKCNLTARTTKDAKLFCGTCMIEMEIEN